MHLIFQNTVSALCYSIIGKKGDSSSLSSVFPNNEVVNFVLQQYQNMPDFLKLPIVILTLAFDGWGLLQGGKLFHLLPPPTRWRQIQIWQNSPIGLCRDLIRFYESLTIFGWYSSLAEK